MPEDIADDVDGSPELPETTESEQMYLITVARAAEEGTEGPFPITALAAGLGVSVVSANEKVHKLAERGLLDYSPYKGVELTDTGRRVARRVLRTRRLWSTFLTDLLGYDAAEADDLACRLEHATPPSTAERLAVYLGDPNTGPLGRPIPPGGESEREREAVPLSRIPVGAAAEIVSVPGDGGQAAFLTAESLCPGTVVNVCGAGVSGLLLETGGRWVRLGAELAESVLVLEGGAHAAG